MPRAPFFQPGPAIQSLRESEFDSNSAYGEVIDNSLQAHAKTIRVRFETVTRPGGRQDIQAVAFGDDGTGMDAHTLENCLTVGWSSRYNDRDGIGRFGVGMTLGAIHECRRVEIWTKVPGGEWLYTYMDLDEIEAKKLTEVPQPLPRKLPSAFADLPGKEHGTLVVWGKYDRQQESADVMIQDFRTWAGRTYRYFIWEAIPPRTTPVVIEIQGEIVKAIDPLYVRTEKTRFPDDPKGKLLTDQELKWPVDVNAPNPEGRTATIRIRMSKLPPEFSPRRGAGGSLEAKERFIHENEGISILRNYREVFYGEVPHWRSEHGWASFEDMDRWWGCEVLFTPDVDRAFQVKNIKRGAVPTRNLKLAIKLAIKPTRETVLEEVRERWRQADLADRAAREAADAATLIKRTGGHEPAEGTAKKAPVPKNQLDAGKNPEAEATRAADAYGHRYNEEERQRLKELFKSQPFTIMEDAWKGPQFYESKFLGGTAVLDYNTSHTFWEAVSELVASLGDEKVNHAEVAKEIRTMLDLMIIAHAKAEAMFSPEVELTADQFTENLRSHWGQYLQSYVKTRLKEREV